MRNLTVLDMRELGKMSRDEAEVAVRARAQSTYLGKSTALARALGRYKFLLSADDRGFGCNLLFDGYWEMWLTLFFCRQIASGSTIIDVGANFGYYTLLFADLVGSSGRVLAFEPNPPTASLLQENVTLNGFSTTAAIHEVALGGSDGEKMRFFSPHGEPKNARVLSKGELADSNRGSVRDVEVATLDKYTTTLPGVDLIKIDAEGAERDIWNGMQKTISDHRPSLLLEFNVPRYADAGEFLTEITRIYGNIASVGYDGVATAIDPKLVLTTHVGEDWLLYFSR